MRVLVAADDTSTRKLVIQMLSQYGECDIAVDGREAITAFNRALHSEEPYHLIYIDELLPELNRVTVLKTIRTMEAERNIPLEKRVKVIRMKSSGEASMHPFEGMRCYESYMSKPIDETEFEQMLQELGWLSKGEE